ncbi:MAG TPA: DDE-type integrase/transposase/recombinase [bacterium]|nr:DDE-type integrase/transposase/recombinase [bacterium]
MSITQKVTLARTAVPAYGLRPILEAVGLPRATWYYYQRRRRTYAEKYRHLRCPLEAIARIHPEYGYRRVTVELRATWGRDINHKVVQRLQRLWGLPLLRRTRHPRPSGIQQAIASAGRHANLISDKADIEPFAVSYADFTELSYAGGQQKGYMIILVDHVTKVVVGWAVGNRKTTEVALQAWERAKQTLATCAASWQGLIVHHDQDPVFIGYQWTSRLLRDGVRVSYSLRGARGNPEMEAFFSRFKTENRSLTLDCQTLDELTGMIARRIDYYNRDRRHSAIGYVAPLNYVDLLDLQCPGKAAYE